VAPRPNVAQPDLKAVEQGVYFAKSMTPAGAVSGFQPSHCATLSQSHRTNQVLREGNQRGAELPDISA